MIIDIVHVLVFRILVGHATEMLLAQQQVIELVFEDDAGVVQSVHDDEVACLHLFLGEWYLREVVFAFVGIVMGTVGNETERVLNGFRLRDGVALLVGQLSLSAESAHNRLVDALPVVHVLTLSPLSLESGLSLVDCHLVVEVPQAVCL